MKYLVQKLQGFLDLQGRNITFNRLYTSVPLATGLLEQNITCVGTLQSNRRGIPDATKQTNGREPFSDEYFWESEKGRLVLHSYAVKTKSTGLRDGLLLSTVQPILGVSKNPKKKPAIYKLYDYTKGGTVPISLTKEWVLTLATLSLGVGLWQHFLVFWILVGTSTSRSVKHPPKSSVRKRCGVCCSEASGKLGSTRCVLSCTKRLRESNLLSLHKRVISADYGQLFGRFCPSLIFCASVVIMLLSTL